MKSLVIGGGSIGKRHLQNLKTLGVEQVGLVETDAQRLQAVACKLGITAFSCMDEGLDWLPDFVVIATPPDLHCEQILDAIRRGFDVFIEKPLCHAADGLCELVNESEKRGIVSLVGCNMRFHPGPAKVKQLLEQERVGKVLFTKIHAGSYLPAWRPETDYRQNYAASQETGGGCILDCIHEIDLARWYLGDVQDVFCLAGHLSSLEIRTEDVAVLLCRHLSGALSEIHLDYVQRTYERGCQIVGEIGSIFWDFNDKQVRWYDAERDQWTCFAQPQDWQSNQMYLDEMQHFLDCVRNRSDSVLSISEAAAAMQIAFAAKVSAREGRLVSTGSARMIVAIVQARMGSSRLPGKSLADISGHPMLWHVVHRVRRARLVDKVVVATSEKSSDDPIVDLCEREGIPCFRGSEDDVLDRFYLAAKAHAADVVVRITGDCPLIDPAVIDRVIAQFQRGGFDYVSNAMRYTYPDGLDTEAFSLKALEQAWCEARKPSDREHVTPHLRSARFRTANVESDAPVAAGQYRWTVDHTTDLEFVRQVYSAFSGNGHFGFQDVLRLLRERPSLVTSQVPGISNEGYYRSLYHQAVAGPATKRTLTQSQTWLARSQKVIPGCAQTFSKSYTQYIQGVAPMFLQRGKGCRVWDVDGNEYIDYVQGLLPNILGYANEEVNRAAMAQLAEGHSFSLPHPLEVELAERLTRLIPCAEMVRFGKNGSDATSGAVRAARAFTGREKVACCGYHGWQDWYIGTTTRSAGVPEAVRALTHPFRYNDLTSLQALFDEHPGEFATVIMEPMNFIEPAPGFLAGVKDLTRKYGAILIFDEICSGFHFGLGGAQKLLRVIPDLACFGKAMGNGFPIACVVGRTDIMQTFNEIFYSFTFAGEVASMAAAMKVLDILENTDALARMEANGRTLQDGLNAMAKEAGLADRVKCIGRSAWSLLKFLEVDGKESLLLKNLFQQEVIKRGVLLLATHNMTAAHDSRAIERTLETYAEVIKTLGAWLQDSNPGRFLEGPTSQPVFRVR